MRHARSICLVSVLVAFLFTGFVWAGGKAESGSTAKTTQLTAWALGNSGPAIKYALPGFEKKYPNIKVHLQVFGWNDLLPKLQATLTAGSGAPDVVEIFSNDVLFLAKNGAFLPLNDRIAPYRSKKELSSFALLDSVDKNGNAYALVWDVSPGLLYYRSDILKSAGVDPASLRTWNDLIAAGAKLRQQGKYIFLTASQSTYPQYWNYFTGMLSQFGGSPFNSQGQITINQDNHTLKVLQKLQQISKSKISLNVDSWWTPAFEAAIKSGKLGAFVSGAFHVSILKGMDPEASGLWRVRVAPTFTDGEATGIFTGGGRGLTIPKQSKNPDAAWTLIQYLMLTPAGVEATWKGGGILPIYTPAYKQPYFDKPDPYYGGETVGRTVIDAVAKMNGHQWFTGPVNGNLMANDIVGPELRDLMLGKTNPEAATKIILSKMKSNMS